MFLLLSRLQLKFVIPHYILLYHSAQPLEINSSMEITSGKRLIAVCGLTRGSLSVFRRAQRGSGRVSGLAAKLFSHMRSLRAYSHLSTKFRSLVLLTHLMSGVVENAASRASRPCPGLGQRRGKESTTSLFSTRCHPQSQIRESHWTNLWAAYDLQVVSAEFAGHQW
jgi:hypothetical protein